MESPSISRKFFINTHSPNANLQAVQSFFIGKLTWTEVKFWKRSYQRSQFEVLAAEELTSPADLWLVYCSLKNSFKINTRNTECISYTNHAEWEGCRCCAKGS